MTQTGDSGGISEPEARRFYDRHGRLLEWGDLWEERAKQVALAWAAVGPGQRVLELGVGTGHFQAYARDRAGEGGLVLGVDLSETMLRLTRERAPGARLLRASVARLPLAGEGFDWVFSTYVLDLLPAEALAATLAEARRVLRPEGRLVVASLTEGQGPLERLLMGTWKWISRVSPERVGGCRPLALASLVEAAGFSVLERRHVGQLGLASEVVLARRGQAPG